MNYLKMFEDELGKRLDRGEDLATIARWASEKVLESYRNGIKAGQQGEQVKRSGQSRRRGLPKPVEAPAWMRKGREE